MAVNPEKLHYPWGGEGAFSFLFPFALTFARPLPSNVKATLFQLIPVQMQGWGWVGEIGVPKAFKEDFVVSKVSWDEQNKRPAREREGRKQ